MASETQEVDESCKILELPDCVLRQLFSYLDSTSLYQLSQTCQYLQSFVEDPVFWKYIDARAGPNSNEKVDYCCNRFHKNTTHALFRAKNSMCGQVPTSFINDLGVSMYRNLKVLALEKQRFCGCMFKMKDFPPSLEELSLKKTYIKRSEDFFQHSYKNMQKLRVLILDGCNWVTCSFIISIAKYENLEILSAVKCFKLHIDMVPYLTTARFGCNKLKVFDCRFSGIGHELLHSFFPKETIHSLYFQSLKSADLDYDQKMFPNSFMHSLPSGNNSNSTNIEGNITDDSLREFVHALASDTENWWPDSFLYQDPYPECTCKNNKEEGSSERLDIVLDDSVVCYPRKKLKCLCEHHCSLVKELPFLISVNKVSGRGQEGNDCCDSTESESSDSDDNCCMFEAANRAILLEPGNGNEPIQQQIIELRPELGGHTRVVLATPLTVDAGNDSQAVPGTSSSTSKNSVNEDAESKAKRRRCDRGIHYDTESSRLSTLSKEYDKNKLVQGQKRAWNEYFENSVEKPDARPTESSRQESHPSTSRLHNHRHLHVPNNVTDPPNIYLIRPPRHRYIVIDDEPMEPWMGPRHFINPLFAPLLIRKDSERNLNLRRLSLRGFKGITDLGLDYIKNLKLSLLDLTYTGVTKEGIESFLIYNPNCRIIHPLYCICKPLNPFQ